MPNRQTDTQLLQALQKGDRAAFTEIYERFWAELYRLAYQKTSDKAVAEELVQDIFVSLWQRRSTLTIEQLKPYLFSALKYTVIDWVEKQTIHDKYKAYYQNFKTYTDKQTEHWLDYKDLHEAIEKELQTLPEKTQEIFRLSRFEHLSIPEIAQQLQIPDKTVEYHLSKALKALRTSLQDFILTGLWMVFVENWTISY